MKGGVLRDRQGHPVEFAVITNAGNLAREKMAAMIQQDLAAIGIKLNVVTLDFASLIERLTKTYAYEACLLGLSNVDLDPNLQMNVWLSSASNHQWNPNQKAPATPWEAENRSPDAGPGLRAQPRAAQTVVRSSAADRLGAGAVPLPAE